MTFELIGEIILTVWGLVLAGIGVAIARARRRPARPRYLTGRPPGLVGTDPNHEHGPSPDDPLSWD